MGILCPFWPHEQSATGGLPELDDHKKAKREALRMAEPWLFEEDDNMKFYKLDGKIVVGS